MIMTTTRSDQEILDLILNFARNDENIRAVVMNGSRVNPQVPKDPFQDFDIVYLVRDVAALKRGAALVRAFGEVMIFQTPDEMGDSGAKDDGRYAYLMQFLDGTRIDLTLLTVERARECTDDSLSRVLLDKDGRIPSLPPPSERSYTPQPPTAKEFADCCNEFWWVSPYVAKGLWRDELFYAQTLFETVLRAEFMKMLTWHFGVETGFQRSPGALGKRISGALDPSLRAAVERTYADARPAHLWDALLEMGALFRRLGRALALHFHFEYPEQDDANVTAYLRHVRELPKDADSIY